MPTLARKREQLIAWFHQCPSCVVAFSGGIDSTVLAKAAFLALGRFEPTTNTDATPSTLPPTTGAVAVYLESESSTVDETAHARKIAEEISIPLVVMQGGEFCNMEFVLNTPERCYHCKKTRFSQLADWASQHGMMYLVEGSNADDQNDYRPGSRASRELNVAAPLAEVGLTKSEIRALAKDWELSNWAQPATPCLATRLAYGIEINSERMRQIEAAEAFLTACGLTSVRVRLHEGELARIEVAPEQIAMFTDASLRESIAAKFSELGFHYLTVDLNGFRSGSMNRFD